MTVKNTDKINIPTIKCWNSNNKFILQTVILLPSYTKGGIWAGMNSLLIENLVLGQLKKIWFTILPSSPHSGLFLFAFGQTKGWKSYLTITLMSDLKQHSKLGFTLWVATLNIYILSSFIYIESQDPVLWFCDVNEMANNVRYLLVNAGLSKFLHWDVLYTFYVGLNN